MPVGEMLQRISQQELTYWMLLQAIDPAGEGRADLRQAIGISAFVNTQISKRRDLTKPNDYHVGELLRKQHRRNAAKRGLVPEWDGKKWWSNFMKSVKKG